jgi:ATP-binding cassette subfamily B protein
LSAVAQLTHISDGRILLNGRDLSAASESDRAHLIGYASTDLPLLPGSLGMNLRYRSSRIADSTLCELARHCGLNSLIDRLGDDLKGRLTGRSDLSVGERQGIALARAMAGTPALLVLDSIDSHLDKSVLLWLCERLREYKGVVIMTASTAKLQRAASQRWTLSEGRLTEVEMFDGVEALPHPTNVLPFERLT